MKTLFATGFEISRNVWTSTGPSGAYLGAGAELGRPLTAAEIDGFTSKIAQGRQKLAAVRAFIAARIDADPMLQRTFNDAVVQRNFWDYLDLINKDQYYADRVWDQIQNPSSAEYDIPDNDLDYTNEWAQVVDIVYSAMQQYGGAPPVARPGAIGPTGLPTGVAPKKGVAPGAMPMAPQPMILGIPQNTFLIGAGLAGLGLLAVALV